MNKISKKHIYALMPTVVICTIFVVYISVNQAKHNEVQSSIQITNSHDYVIYIGLDDRILYLLDNDKCIKKYPVAIGKSDSPSPIGFWKVINKGKWSGGFGDRWLGLNVPWGKYGIHGTNRPGSIGWAASHGCIRMKNKHVIELYELVPHGTPVVIVDGSFGPFGQGFKPIKIGDRGADVYEVQRRLKELGYYKGYVDGIYGESMKTAVHKFQKDKGLEVKNTITEKDLQAMGFLEFE